MNQFLKHKHLLILLFGLLTPLVSKADIWDSPQENVYYSENNRYKLVVTPKVFNENYYRWKYYTSNRHPQTRKILRQKEKFLQNITAQDTILAPCIGKLYRDTTLIWEKTLLNDVNPVFAIISNDGSSVATFDNWYSLGYGVNVFVVYNDKGEAKRTYKLEEISPFPLNDYMTSISSIHWRKGVRFIDNERVEIVFGAEKDLQTKRVYNTKSFEFEE